jgi:hypothetical protein
MSRRTARYAAAPVRYCSRCGKPLPATRDVRGTVCKACAGKNAAGKPAAKAVRRCRRCREPIPMTQAQGICKSCRHGLDRTPVTVTCSEGHAFQVQAPDGRDVKCAVCWQQRGEANWVLVRRPRDGGR